MKFNTEETDTISLASSKDLAEAKKKFLKKTEAGEIEKYKKKSETPPKENTILKEFPKNGSFIKRLNFVNVHIKTIEVIMTAFCSLPFADELL